MDQTALALLQVLFRKIESFAFYLKNNYDNSVFKKVSLGIFGFFLSSFSDQWTDEGGKKANS